MRLTVSVPRGDAAAEAPVPAEVLDESLTVVKRFMIKPGKRTTVTVKPGRNIVVARLPDGRTVRAVTDSPTAKPTGSPIAKPSGQTGKAVTKRVSSGRTSGGPARGSCRGSRPGRASGPMFDLPFDVATEYETPPPSKARATSPVPATTMSVRLTAADKARVVSDGPIAPPGTSARMWDLRGGKWRFADRKVTVAQGSEGFLVLRPADTGEDSIYALQISGEGIPSRFVLLPPRGVRVELRRGTSASALDEGLLAEAHLENAAAEAIVGYVASGDFADARSVLQASSVSMVQQKSSDPIAAAVGGYCLLQTGGLGKVGDWPLNLAHSYPWLPDGAVIAAWRSLLDGGQGAAADALDALLDAADRGLPLFAEGLRRLYDGLLLFEGSEMPEMAADRFPASLKHVRSYVACASGSSRFTTFYGRTPDTPSNLPIRERAGEGATMIAP